MAFFPFSQSGTTEIAPAGVGASAIGYRVQVTGSSDWVGSILIRSNTAPPGNVPSYQNLGLQNPSTREELPAGTPITTSGAWIVSVPPGNLVATYTHTAGVVNVTVSPATAGVTDSELAAAFTGAGFRTYGQDTPVTMLSAAVATLLGESLNVLAFGAVGDGVTDDTGAIQAAIAAAYAIGSTGASAPFGRGAEVLFPPGVYIVSEDIDIPPQVILRGSGIRTTVIRWGSGTITSAVVTSNLDDAHGFVHGAGITYMTIDANGQAVGLKVRGWNEGCVLDYLMVREYTDTVDGGVQLLSASAGSNTHTTQNITIQQLWLFGMTGCRNLLMDGCNRVTIENLTVSLVGGQAGPMLCGIELRQVVRQSVFINANIEDCTRPYDLGTVGSISGNTFVNVLFDVPVGGDPADTTIGSLTGTMGFIVRDTAGTEWGSLVGGLRDGWGYDYVYVDAALNITRTGVGNGGGTTNLSRIFGRDAGQTSTPRIHRIISSTTDDTTPSVAEGNVINLNNQNATSVTTFDDGTDGQVLICRFTNGNTTLVDGASLQLAGGVNFVGSSNDTLSLILVSGVWTETGRSVN